MVFTRNLANLRFLGIENRGDRQTFIFSSDHINDTIRTLIEVHRLAIDKNIVQSSC